MMVWQAELHQGKHSIILDAKKVEAREVIQRAIKAADVVLVNKMDNQLVSLGLNREALDVANRKAIPRQPQATAAPRLHLGCTSAAPRLHLGCTSASSPEGDLAAAQIAPRGAVHAQEQLERAAPSPAPQAWRQVRPLDTRTRREQVRPRAAGQDRADDALRAARPHRRRSGGRGRGRAQFPRRRFVCRLPHRVLPGPASRHLRCPSAAPLPLQ